PYGPPRQKYPDWAESRAHLHERAAYESALAAPATRSRTATVHSPESRTPPAPSAIDGSDQIEAASRRPVHDGLFRAAIQQRNLPARYQTPNPTGHANPGGALNQSHWDRHRDRPPEHAQVSRPARSGDRAHNRWA